MASNVIDSRVFGVMFAENKMKQIFSDENKVQKWLDTEAALARAQAKLGIIEQRRADKITKFAKAELLDLDAIGEHYKNSITIVPLLTEFKKVFDDDSGEFVHWGATSQDIMDNGMVLQMKEAFEYLKKLLETTYKETLNISEKYKNTVMAGRTHVIHALPITFGFKTAMWAAEIRRSLDRLEEIKPRVLVGQLSGAVGTLASQEGKGLEMQALMMEDLGLNVPVISWHPSRDHMAEYVSLLAIIAGTIGRIAREILSLQRTEICEVEEPFYMGKVGSSTMPHKRNPQVCEGVIALTRIVRAQAPLMVEAMGCENERDWGCEAVEWDAIPKSSIHTAAALDKLNDILKNLIVYPKNMARNLNALKGAMLSEAVMLHLGEKLGRLTAHEIVYEVCMKAFSDKKPVIDDLMERDEVTKHFTRADLEEIMQPEKYVGLSAVFVDRVLEDSKSYFKQ
ncbi:MAG: adenylosuccinate lyase [Campylobacter sp.]|nr:adenylosuccinate lyase [Campylobacter sp.]